MNIVQWFKVSVVSLVLAFLVILIIFSTFHYVKGVNTNKIKFECIEWKTWCEAPIDCKSLQPIGEDEEGKLWKLVYVNQTFDENCDLKCLYVLDENKTHYIELKVSYNGSNKATKCIKSALYCDGSPDECNRRYGI